MKENILQVSIDEAFQLHSLQAATLLSYLKTKKTEVSSSIGIKNYFIESWQSIYDHTTLAPNQSKRTFGILIGAGIIEMAEDKTLKKLFITFDVGGGK